MSKASWLLTGVFLLQLAAALPAIADHPIEVQRKNARGEHFEALVLYERLAKRNMTLDARLAAARSAWAMGLVDQAVSEFEHLLLQDQLTERERVRIHLMRAILEYQEERHQVAALFAERAVSGLPEGTQRGQAWLVWGDSLQELKSYGAAQERYQSALKELAPDERVEAYFRMGLNLIRLGKLPEAQEALENVPLGHPRTPAAIRELARIALQNNRFNHASFWLERGKEDYPDDFLDSWVDYALIRVAQETGELERARDLRKKAKEKYPPSDPWVTLLNASAEGFEWQVFFGTAGGTDVVR